MLRGVGSITLASCIWATAALPAPTSFDESFVAGEMRLIELYQKFSDTVVKVKVATKTTDESGKEKVALTVQSGFYIDAKGTVLTNAVPMQEGPRLRIEKEGVQLLAVPIASDSRTNIALVQVAKPPSKIHFIDIDQTKAKPPIGSLAYAITSPLDLAPTPKLGIVSGRESSFSDINFPFTYTRVSIPSGPAEGGAPVFDTSGDLIGISVASLPDIGSSYVVPSAQLQRIVNQLRTQNRVDHPTIKAKISERVDPSDLEHSLLVSNIEKGSAADQSGLKEGDQIVSLNATKLSTLDAWRDALFACTPDSFVSLVVIRDDAEKEITLLLETD